MTDKSGDDEYPLTRSEILDYSIGQVRFREKADRIRNGLQHVTTDDLIHGYPFYMDRWMDCVSHWAADIAAQQSLLKKQDKPHIDKNLIGAFWALKELPDEEGVLKIHNSAHAQSRSEGPMQLSLKAIVTRAKIYLAYKGGEPYSDFVAKLAFHAMQDVKDTAESFQSYILFLRAMAGPLGMSYPGERALMRVCDLIALDSRSSEIPEQEILRERAKREAEAEEAELQRFAAGLAEENKKAAAKPKRRSRLEGLVSAEEIESANQTIRDHAGYPDPVVPEDDVPEAAGLVVIPAGDATVKRLSQGNAGKKLALVQVDDPARVRSILVDEFPHAVEVIDALCQDLVGKPYVRFRPSLIAGYPGAGKTRLVRRIAEVTGLKALVYSASSASDSSVAGTSKQWSTARMSVMLGHACAAQQANALVAFDEVDKASESRHNGRFSDAVLPFLERESSRAIFDQGLEVQVDLSAMNYLMTCNDLNQVPWALRDRLRVLKMSQPKREHLPVLARNMVADIRAEREIEEVWMPDLDGEELEMVARNWRGGSMRVLARIVDLVVSGRDALRMKN